MVRSDLYTQKNSIRKLLIAFSYNFLGFNLSSSKSDYSPDKVSLFVSEEIGSWLPSEIPGS